MMPGRVLLLSIRPEYAEKIFEGVKTVELRRVRPRIDEGDWVLVYVSSPVKALVGAFKVDHVVSGPPQDLWGIVQHAAGIAREEFKTYYDGAAVGFGIFFSNVRRFSEPAELQDIRQQCPGFHPPQGYRYLRANEVDVDRLLSLAGEAPGLVF